MTEEKQIDYEEMEGEIVFIDDKEKFVKREPSAFQLSVLSEELIRRANKMGLDGKKLGSLDHIRVPCKGDVYILREKKPQ